MRNQMLYKVLLVVLSVLLSSAAYAQKIEVGGKVVDEKGEPMPGVGVVDKNNPKNGTITDLDGLYKIKVAKDGILEFSFISYETALVLVEGKSVVNVSLKPALEQLDKAATKTSTNSLLLERLSVKLRPFVVDLDKLIMTDYDKKSKKARLRSSAC